MTGAATSRSVPGSANLPSELPFPRRPASTVGCVVTRSSQTPSPDHGGESCDPIANALLGLGLPPEELDQLDDVRQAQVELWAHGVVVDHDPIVRFFAAWQSWERREVAAGRIPDVLQRKTYGGAELLDRYGQWQERRGGCLVDGQRYEQFGALLLPEAFDAAQDTLYELLPPCRGSCSCL